MADNKRMWVLRRLRLIKGLISSLIFAPPVIVAGSGCAHSSPTQPGAPGTGQAQVRPASPEVNQVKTFDDALSCDPARVPNALVDAGKPLSQLRADCDQLNTDKLYDPCSTLCVRDTSRF